jgi:uncharacterized protein YggE
MKSVSHSVAVAVVSAGIAIALVAVLAIGLPLIARSNVSTAASIATLEVAPPVQAAAALDVAPASAAAPTTTIVSAASAAPAAQDEPTATISVLGEGVVTLKPDIARLSMGVLVEKRSLSAAQTEASDKMNAVIDRLVGMGISRDDIQTVNFSVNPVYDYPNDGTRPELRGFQVANQVSVTIRDIGKTGEVADAVIDVGATTIGGLSFDVSNMQGAKDQAREQAMEDAKRKGEQLARLAGVSLGRPLSISATDTGGPPPQVYRGDVAAAPAAAAAPPPIEPGSSEVRTTVNVTYFIQ